MSFKVLGECPLAIVLLFQMYARAQQLPVHTQKFVPVVVDCLGQEPPQDAASKKKAVYADFMSAQVKVSESI